MSTISDIANLIEDSERANIMLPNGTMFHINDTLYYSKSIRNFLNFKNIHRNGYHIETMNEGNTECLYITSIVYGKKLIMKKLTTRNLRNRDGIPSLIENRDGNFSSLFRWSLKIRDQNILSLFLETE